jgi:hypothetical protein
MKGWKIDGNDFCGTFVLAIRTHPDCAPLSGCSRGLVGSVAHPREIMQLSRPGRRIEIAVRSHL